METALAILVGGAIALAILRYQHQEKARRKRHRWDPPAGTGVIQIRRPFTMSQSEWNQVLSRHKAAGWNITTSNPLINQVTLEK